MTVPQPRHVSDHNWPGISSVCRWPQAGQVTVEVVNQTSAMIGTPVACGFLYGKPVPVPLDAGIYAPSVSAFLHPWGCVVFLIIYQNAEAPMVLPVVR